MSMRSFSRIGLIRPMRLVSRIATRTTATWSRYGRKKATIRRIVWPRRSLGTGAKSRAGPPPNGPPAAAPHRRRPPRPTPPVAVARAAARERHLPGGRGRGFGDALGLEPALGVDGGLAAVAGRGHGLAVAMVVDVAGDEHAVDLGAGLVVDDEVALRVDLEPVAERLRVRARSRWR